MRTNATPTLPAAVPSAPTSAAAAPASHAVLAALWLLIAAPAAAQNPAGTLAPGGELKTITAAAAETALPLSYDGVIEALRQTTIAAQVPGAVVRLDVKAGDRVRAGQLLVQLDARAAAQTAEAGAAQVQAARAALEVAKKDFERQKSLFDSQFISATAFDRARAEYRAAEAQAAAQMAQAGAAQTTAGFYTVRAPYAGVVAEVPVTLGDMAMPGRTLVTLYDPSALRVSAAVPQSAAAHLSPGVGAVRAEVPALPAAQRQLTPVRVQVLPAADAATHTVTVRADLPPQLGGLLPGQFARLWLPGSAATASNGRAARPVSIWVPAAAIVRRSEMTGLYVLDAQSRPRLRQVRLGRSDGDSVEVLTGLAPGERVAAEGQLAARLVAAASAAR